MRDKAGVGRGLPVTVCVPVTSDICHAVHRRSLMFPFVIALFWIRPVLHRRLPSWSGTMFGPEGNPSLEAKPSSQGKPLRSARGIDPYCRD